LVLVLSLQEREIAMAHESVVTALDTAHLGDVTAYVNAGGRGTRLNTIFTPDARYGIAKALLEVGNPPVALVDHHINRMSQSAFRNIVIAGGDLLDVSKYIAEKYAADDRIDSFSTFGKEQLGTGGDLVLATRERPELFGDSILVNNVDTILDIDYREFAYFHSVARSGLSIALTRKRGVPNQDAFHVDQNGQVVFSAEAEVNRMSADMATALTARRGSSTGAVVVDTEFVRGIEWDPSHGQLSLYRDIMGQALQEGAVAGYDNGDKFFLDVGTATTWNEFSQSAQAQQYLHYELAAVEEAEVAS
jgi:NDP-sugar pyrophosphorylase family protein